MCVCVFFPSDRASTIPSNLRGCQSDTWSAGQEKCENSINQNTTLYRHFMLRISVSTLHPYVGFSTGHTLHFVDYGMVYSYVITVLIRTRYRGVIFF